MLDRALALAAEGDQLIESSHYAVDSILPKCSELRTISEEISSFMRAKKTHLLKCLELHQSLEKVNTLMPVYAEVTLHILPSRNSLTVLRLNYTLDSISTVKVFGHSKGSFE